MIANLQVNSKIAVRESNIYINEKDINLFGILDYFDDNWPMWLIENTFDISEEELGFILDFVEENPEIAENIYKKQRSMFHQRLFAALHGTHRTSIKEYGLVALMLLGGALILVASLTSTSSVGLSGQYAVLAFGILFTIMGILGLYVAYKTEYTFNGYEIAYARIIRPSFAWSILYTDVVKIHQTTDQHWKYLCFTTKDGKEYRVQCIDSIKAVLDTLPETDQFLL